ncbi:MAG: BACON domain-containing protein [Acidobacteriia bacterium]|nr:BACON domain-containing protein [Terriglobia bacterium]
MFLLLGRCLPFLIALSFAVDAQVRHAVEIHVTVNIDAIARSKVRPAVSKPTPRPLHVPNPRSVRRAASRDALPAAVPDGGQAAYGGFQGLLDVYGATPPDTGGAVGPHDVVTMLNSQVSIQSRTGAARPDYPIDLPRFWSGLGAFTKVFDPRMLYDRVNDRWMASAGANPFAKDAVLLIGVSETGDPGGNWDQFEIQTGAAGYWADYPVLGFSQNWIVLSANLFRLPPEGAYSHTELYVFDKAGLYQGADATYVTFTDSQGQFTPAIDQDQQSDTLYFAQAFADPDAGRIRISVLRGPAGAESFIAGVAEIAAGGPWAESGSVNGDLAPQRGIWYKVDTGDSRLQNCVLRGGTIWCAHTIFLPPQSPTRASVEWFQVDPSASRVVQRGRIDDASGISFYAFPSIAVNKDSDMLVGYTRFTPNDYPSAAFSFRKADDPPGALRPGVIFKQGEAFYAAPGADEGSNRWGDTSGTVVDPADDLAFWTIQEYAATPTDHYLGRWGTWWANVPVSAEALHCSYSVARSTGQFDAAGGKGSITVTTAPGCPWMAASNNGWIAIASGSPGTGSGTVAYSVSPNSYITPLSGTVSIAGQTLTVMQAGSSQ